MINDRARFILYTGMYARKCMPKYLHAQTDFLYEFLVVLVINRDLRRKWDAF